MRFADTRASAAIPPKLLHSPGQALNFTACSDQAVKEEDDVIYETAIAPTALPVCKIEDGGTQVSACPDEGRIAKALLEYQMSCRCKSCLSEIIMTGLRAMHLYRNPPCGDVDPEEWRWSMAVCEPFTTIEAALLDTNDGQLIKLAYPSLASLIEKELRARYEEDFELSHEMQERPRGIFCAAASRN